MTQVDPHTLKTQYASPVNLEKRIRLQRDYRVNPHAWHAWALDQIVLPEGARVLELGCGPGELWRENAQRPPRWRLMLSDFSPGMAAAARANPGGWPALATDAGNIALRDGACDAVIANHMLYHMLDISRAITEIRRVLAPGGALIASTNGLSHMRELIELVAAYDPDVPFIRAIASRFGLENGAAYLRPHFDTIEIRRYSDSLHVTDPQPAIDYILSATTILLKSDSWKHGLEAHVRRAFDAHGGVLDIHKDAGMFIAH